MKYYGILISIFVVAASKCMNDDYSLMPTNTRRGSHNYSTVQTTSGLRRLKIREEVKKHLIP